MTLEGKDYFDNQYYATTRRLLTIVGLWPYLEISKRVPYIVAMGIVLFIAIYVHVYVLLSSEWELNGIIELIQTFLPSIIFTLSYWNLLYNSELMKEILEHVRNDWNRETCEDKLGIMHKYTAQGKQYSLAIAYACFFYIGFLMFPSVLRLCLYLCGKVQKTDLILPVHHEVFITTISFYVVSFVAQLVTITTICTAGIAYYSMFILTIQHGCSLLSCVTNKIDQSLIENEYKCTWTHTSSKYDAELELIVDVLKNYNNAIKFFELITSLYGKIYVVETFSAFTFLMMDFIYFFQLLDWEMNLIEILKICLFVLSTVLGVLAYCHLGEQIIEHSTNVYATCRMVPFYTLTDRTNKLFLLLIIRSMKPCSISFGGVAVASHELLAQMMKTSFSFATVCYNIR